MAAGADGLLVEVHPDPERIRSDGESALTPARFLEMMQTLGRVAAAVGRRGPGDRKGGESDGVIEERKVAS